MLHVFLGCNSWTAQNLTLQINFLQHTLIFTFVVSPSAQIFGRVWAWRIKSLNPHGRNWCFEYTLQIFEMLVNETDHFAKNLVYRLRAGRNCASHIDVTNESLRRLLLSARAVVQD